MAPWVCRAALQRSVGKIFYQAGFEDFQPSALESVTDLASQYFTKLVGAFKAFRDQPKPDEQQSRHTFEEQVLHSLHEHGLDLEALETYVKDDVDRLGTKLGVVHERMKSHLADLLVCVSIKVLLILLLTADSDLLSATMLGRMVQVLSTTAASSLLAATLQKTSTKISSALGNSVSHRSSAWRRLVCLSTSSRTACTAPIKPRTKVQ